MVDTHFETKIDVSNVRVLKNVFYGHDVWTRNDFENKKGGGGGRGEHNVKPATRRKPNWANSSSF